MPTPLGHALAGLAAGTAASGGRTILGPVKDLVFFVGFGVLADVDFLPGLILGEGRGLAPGSEPLHRRRGGGRDWSPGSGFGADHSGGWLALGALAAYASHILLDYLNVDTKAPLWDTLALALFRGVYAGPSCYIS